MKDFNFQFIVTEGNYGGIRYEISFYFISLKRYSKSIKKHNIITAYINNTKYKFSGEIIDFCKYIERRLSRTCHGNVRLHFAALERYFHLYKKEIS